MTNKTQKAICDGVLQIGDLTIDCAVMEDGTRVLSQRGLLRTVGSGYPGGRQFKARMDESGDGVKVPIFLTAKNVKPFITEELSMTSNNVIRYTASKGGVSHGVEAKVLPMVCDVWLKARDAGVLRPSQLHLAKNAELLVRALAHTAIIALVDEATGYQEIREKDDLQRFLALYLTEERLKWTKQFPDDLWNLVYELRGWGKPIGSKRTPLLGKFVNEYIYDPLPSGVLEELKKRNPLIESTHRRRWEHHQFFSFDIGQPDLRNQLLQVMTLLRAASNWKGFKSLFAKAFKRQIQSELFDEEESRKPKK